jgi:plasmid stability protein
MSTLVIKNMPDQLHEKLRRQAECNHRSLNKETVAVLEKALDATRRPPKLPPPLKLRGGFRPSIEDIEAAIADDRYSHYKSLDEVNRYVDELRADRDETEQ